jgi:hypothetical protein
MPVGIAHQVAGKGQAPRHRSALLIEHAGDDLVRVASRQTAEDRQARFIGASGGSVGARQGDLTLDETTATPAQGQMSPVVAENGDYDFFEQGTQEFLLVAGRRRGGRTRRS